MGTNSWISFAPSQLTAEGDDPDLSVPTTVEPSSDTPSATLDLNTLFGFKKPRGVKDVE